MRLQPLALPFLAGITTALPLALGPLQKDDALNAPRGEGGIVSWRSVAGQNWKRGNDDNNWGIRVTSFYQGRAAEEGEVDPDRTRVTRRDLSWGEGEDEVDPDGTRVTRDEGAGTVTKGESGVEPDGTRVTRDEKPDNWMLNVEPDGTRVTRDDSSWKKRGGETDSVRITDVEPDGTRVTRDDPWHKSRGDDEDSVRITVEPDGTRVTRRGNHEPYEAMADSVMITTAEEPVEPDGTRVTRG